ncbi:MAG: hypothetical protein QXK12_08500 [Candidatus Nezhaarchaeales archaeon]
MGREMSTMNKKVLIVKALNYLEELRNEALQKSCACRICMKMRTLAVLSWLREALEEGERHG